MCLSPLHRHQRAASTPATTASRRFGSGGSTLEVPFRPRGFSPPRRLPPLRASRAYCIPLPILGSTAFPSVGVPVRRPRPFPPLSRDAGPYPPKNSLPTAGTRHRVRCPLAVLARSPLRFRRLHCWRSAFFVVGGSGASASRLCSIVRSGVVPAVAGGWTIRSFLGFVPFRGPSSQPSVPLPAAFSRLASRRVSPSGRRRGCAPCRPLRRRSGGAVVSLPGQRLFVEPKLVSRRLVIGVLGRSRSPEPDPVGHPFVGSRRRSLSGAEVARASLPGFPVRSVVLADHP